jgi:type I restriction enzyme R subunit
LDKVSTGAGNATRIAFTGTPIEKTEETFGDYIDKYTMRQSIEDGVTLEIVYEGRTHTAEVEDTPGADRKFEDVFKDYNIKEKVEILAYGTRRAYLESTDTIAEKAADMMNHYAEQVYPNRYKAQVVCVSKEAAHRYKLALDKALADKIAALEEKNPTNINYHELASLRTEVIISEGDHNAKPHLKAYADSRHRKLAVAGFKLPFGKTDKDENDQQIDGNIGVLVVVDMLLTGFDAPIEQVMYLDKVIVNHSLLQAIARVNRVYDDRKNVGFVVDYVGMGNHLKKALDAYWEKEQQEIMACLRDDTSLFVELKQAHQALQDIFDKYGLSAFSDPDDLFNLFYDENTRHEFMEAFKAFSKALDNVFPRKEALDYIDELNRFAEINVLASQHLRDQRISLKGVSEKLRSITDEFLRSKGITVKVEPISIMDEAFLDHVNTRKRVKTKAAEVEHAIRHFIDINLDEDPELYASFAEELKRILAEFMNNWEDIYRLLEELRAKIRSAQQEPTFGLHRKRQMPIFRKLHNFIYEKREPLTEDEISNLISWTKEIYGKLKVELAIVGFWGNTASVNRLRGEISNYLAEECHQLPGAFANRVAIANEILAWARDDRVTSSILYAED